MVLDRRYAAVVEGRLPQTKGTIATLLREDRNRKVWASCNGTGEEAATDYTVLREGGTTPRGTLAPQRARRIRYGPTWNG